MAYRYSRQEPVSRGTRRIVRERLQEAIEQLGLEGDQMHEGIHEARKRFKEIRAVLRLARAELGDRYRVENRWYRDAGRALSAVRDAQAALETWDKLCSRFPQLCIHGRAEAVARRLKSRLGQVGGDQGEIETPRTAIRQALPAAHERVERWPIEAAGFDALREGAKRVYKQGRRNMRDAYESGDSLHFHEWRKRVKDLWYHTKLLRPVWHDAMKMRETGLKQLSDMLGDDHDLVVFAQLIEKRPGMFGPQEFRSELNQCIAVRQQELRADACWLGHRLYAERPKAYVERIEAYWRLWRPLRLR
ncbi:MAG TPA: CHAD domain-containing protein [Gammaproteobacteria bacterium]|nr:CHAD domain-containing protein [Gammaproteobacteria bacterium]